jgi:hypothetical protein
MKEKGRAMRMRNAIGRIAGGSEQVGMFAAAVLTHAAINIAALLIGKALVERAVSLSVASA